MVVIRRFWMVCEVVSLILHTSFYALINIIKYSENNGFMIQYYRGDFVSLLEQLNEQQLEAVKSVHTHIRIVAGAGSGKTRVITTRIAYLINECHVYPNQILAITFTNKAAKEMRERVETFLGAISKAVRISTIHAFCVRLLREDIFVLGYPRSFTILDSDDQKSILRDAYKQYQIDVKTYSYPSVLSYISYNKTQFIDPKTAKTSAVSNVAEQVKADIYAYYERRLKAMYALDFDDLLIYAYRVLEKWEDIREKWQHRFTYLHVDEFQDVDQLQYAIIKFLVKKDSYLCVVGDPDQTIYTWRGARHDIIMNFEKDFPQSKTVILNENYRSTQHILNGANALIKHNTNRIDKDLFTRIKRDEKIVHFTSMDDENEAVWVASKIKVLSHNDVRFQDIAVLYRSNYLSRGLEKALLNFQIPYRIYGGIRFYERAEIKDALSYLRLLAPAHEDDAKALCKNLAIKRIINIPKRGIGTKTIEKIELQGEYENTNMYEVLCKLARGNGKVNTNIRSFVKCIEECIMLSKYISIDQLLQRVLEKSGYLQYLQEHGELDRLENIEELVQDIATFVENNPQGTLQDYLQEISLYTDKEETSSKDLVQLMTIHAAKGLEFDTVFVYSLSEGIFPNGRSISSGEPQALEEERRLAYVAFTRAKRQLYISDSNGYSYVLDGEKETSRFVRELPGDCVEEAGAKTGTWDVHDKDTYSTDECISLQQKQPERSSEYAQTQIVKSEQVKLIEPNRKQKGKIKKGDLVNHIVFGDGVVIKLENALAIIAFDQKYGIRKILASHPSLTKK